MSKPSPLSLSRTAGELVFLSGSLGTDPSTGLIPKGDITVQTEHVIGNLERELQKLGLGLQNVIKTTVFLTDMRNFDAMNDVYRSRFPEPFPARSTIGVAALPHVDGLVEIELVAMPK